MSRVSQILLIADDESDSDLIQLELDKLDIEVQLDVICKEDQLIGRLENNPPDLIISSYTLPTLSGTEALNIVRENHPYLPVILISESIGEEKAVDVILEGASDYVTKQNLDRLGPAILRETGNYKEHTKQRALLEETRNRYESLIQSVNGIVWEADADTFEFHYISPKSKDLLGYTPEEWLSKPNFWQEHIHPDDRKEAIEFCHYKTKQGVDHSFEYRMLDANDEIIWLRDYVTVVTIDGKPDQLRGLMVDISKEKEAERQRDKAYEIAGIGHWELDLIHEELHWSDMIKKLHEVDHDYEPDLESALDFYKKGEHRTKISNAVEKAIENGESFDEELKIITANNREKWIRAVGEPEFRNGKCVRILGSTQNITNRKEIELKFRDVVEHSTNMFYRHNTDHQLTYVSPQSQEFLGCSQEQAQKQWTEFVTDHPINKKGYEHTQRAIETGETQPAFPLQLQKETGEKIWVRVNEAPITENGETIAIVGSLTDITKQKHAEEQIKETNQKLTNAQKIAKLGYWELNIETDQIYWSDQTYQIWEFSPDKEITFDLILERMHPEDREDFVAQNEKVLDGQGTLNLEHRILLPDGSVKWVRVLGNIKGNTLEGTVQDITEKKELQLLLNQTNRLAKVGSWELNMFDDDEDKMYWSETTREIFEVDDDYDPTLTGSFEFYEPESKERTQKAVDKALSEGIPFDEELLITTAKGNKRWIRCIGQTDFADGECKRMYGSYQNIHEQKMSERELARRNTFIETVLDNLPIGIAVNHIDTGETVLMNSKFSEIYGWPEDVLKDVDTFFEKIYPDKEYRQQRKSETLADIESGDPDRMQWSNIEITTQDGEKRIVDAKNIPLFDQNQMISTVIDVTAEVMAEREKVETLQRIGDAFFAVDENWIVTYWNKRAEQILGTSSEDIVGKNLWDVWDVYDDTVELDFYTQYHKAVDEQVTVNFEEFYPGVEKWFEVSAYPSKTGLSVYFRDVTERKKNHQQLKQLNQELEARAEELEKINAELEQFAYVASHDLQEPLRMVTSFLTRLEKRYADQLDEKAKQYIDFAVDGARRMRRIILDLLNYSRMDQNEYEKESIDANQLIDEILKLEHTAINESNAEISYNELPIIEAAETPIQQVFQNLISNSIKYQKSDTDPKITIEGKETEEFWQFSVRDNGIGIKEKFQDHIFAIFQRLHTQDEYSGTGIGLAISKKIIEKHGGEIWVESQEGKGSTFYFTIAKPEQQK